MIQVKLLTATAQIPKRGSFGAAGLDLYASEDSVVRPNSRRLIKTGVAMAIPYGQVGLIWSRSKLANKKLIDVKAGVIDSDYRGEVMVLLHNEHKHDYFNIKAGDRIGQILIQLVDMSEPVEVASLNDTDRQNEGVLCEDLRLVDEETQRISKDLCESCVFDKSSCGAFVDGVPLTNKVIECEDHEVIPF